MYNNAIISKENLVEDNYINNIFSNISFISYRTSVEFIESFFSDISGKINADFNVIEKYYSKKYNETLLTHIKLMLLSMFGYGKKTSYSAIELNNKLKTLDSDLIRYEENFSDCSDELKNGLINLFKVYYEMIINFGNKKDLKELYAFYQTMITCVLHMLPKNYLKDIIELENFAELKKELEIIKFNEKFFQLKLNAFHIENLEENIKKYIEEKYATSIYEYQYNLSKKRI